MQLRGARLKAYLECRLRELIELHQTGAQLYVYSQKNFASYARVSRETVRKYQDSLDSVLRDALVLKKEYDGEARIRNLQQKVITLQIDLAKAKLMYEAIRAQHVGIFESLLVYSVDINCLVQRAAETKEVERIYKQCVLCGGKLDI
ncbi:hypothetical protein NF675_04445 [Pseudomonas siliginis]|uniref:hypothetical protein n=1 Tax=Pseudomonas siliginis TaxID=2842346 RepID=UPI002091ED9C|nr:hypothetical protein [Pseudomonas siliginis]UST75343.1 hypothetical protein NF675_04445 [Pseudomonas siliginis]